jgi:hypothetical protein
MSIDLMKLCTLTFAEVRHLSPALKDKRHPLLPLACTSSANQEIFQHICILCQF